VSADTYRALLVANSTFPNDTHNLPDLEGPRNDPALLRDALCDDRYGMFPTGNVRLVVERTMAQVLQETEDFLLGAHRQDTVLLYYSGHGMLDLGGELYLCARDTRSDRLRSTAVKASDLNAMIQASAAGTTIILLDCCHSGAFKGGELTRALAGRGRFVVTSSRTGELANDAHRLNRASMFTHHVVEGMLGGAPDGDGDGLVGIGDLYTYVHARLTSDDRQIPQRSFAGSGDVPVARRPAPAVPDASSGPADPGPPALELSEALIELGPVEPGEELPAERVAVLGGGDRSWTVECAAPWVSAGRDGNDVVLGLRPGPGAGTHRANVHVRDERTGMVRTIRVVVRTAAPTAGAPPEAPDGAPEAAEPTAPVAAAGATGPADPAGPRAGRFPWFAMAMLAVGVAGAALTASGIGFLAEVERQSGGENAFLRHHDLGPGLGTSALGGVLLVLVAGGALAVQVQLGSVPARWRHLLAGTGLGLAAPLAVERAGMHLAWEPATYYSSWTATFGVAPALAAAVATALCLAVVREARTAASGPRWAPPWLAPAGVASAALWGVGATVPIYDDQAHARSWVDATNSTGIGVLLTLLVVVLAGGVVVAATRLGRDAGRGLLSGLGAFVLLVEAIDLATLAGAPDHRQGAGIAWMLVPGAAYVATTFVGAHGGAMTEAGRHRPAPG
jgi:hypothetical protein